MSVWMNEATRKEVGQQDRNWSEAGLTLVEIAVVALLFSIMSTVLYNSINGIIRAKEAIESQRTTLRTATYLFTRMTKELSGRFPEALASDPDEASGRRAQVRNFLGINRKNGKFDNDRIRFASASAGQSFSGAFSNYGLVEVEYRLEEDPDRERKGSLGDDAESLVLVREELPASVNDGDVRNSRRVVFPLARDVVSLNFRYLNRGEWKNDWNTVRLALPVAVEITLKLRGDDGTIRTYKTAVATGKERRRRTTTFANT